MKNKQRKIKDNQTNGPMKGQNRQIETHGKLTNITEYTQIDTFIKQTFVARYNFEKRHPVCISFSKL